MSILITFLILLLTAVTLVALRIIIPGFRYNWLFAVAGALFAWLSVPIWQLQLPISLQFAGWQPATIFSQTPTFIADSTSWLFVFSLVTLCFAIIITTVVRARFPSPISWSGTLILTALGMLSVVADNPLTLVLVWAAIDLVELAVQIWYSEDPKLSERVVIAFASRAAGILVLLWADVISAAGGQVSSFHLLTPRTGLYLLIAAGLRVGVLPLHLPYVSESTLRRGFGTGLRMVSAASSLILLYVPAFGISSLPFSLTATGWNSGGTGFWLSFPFLILSHAMLIAGFIRHAQRTNIRTSNPNQPIWGKNVYPIGIVFLLLVTVAMGLVGWNGTLQFGNIIVGVIVSLLSVGLLWLTPRLRILNPVRAHWVRPTQASWLDWIYQALWNLYRQLGRASNAFTTLLEGESGIMWTILFLVLFITVFTRRTP